MGSYSLTKKGVSRYDWTDPYRIAVGLTWPQFLAGIFGGYLAVTSIFAAAYTLVPGAVANARPRDFADHFFFSIETLATVGYGEMYPASFYGHLIATLEILTGVAFTAIFTGLIFVRFSKPRAKFIFADHPVVTRHNGRSTLMLRVGNGRAVVMSDAYARMSVLISEKTSEGAQFRRTHQLALVREKIPVFPLTWTLMHEIDEHSPLHGLDRASVASADVRLFVSMEARDPDLSSVVHDLRYYTPDSVLFNMRYVDVIRDDETGRPCADMTQLSTVEPDNDA
jgi:inward rectifier potassium channel